MHEVWNLMHLYLLLFYQWTFPLRIVNVFSFIKLMRLLVRILNSFCCDKTTVHEKLNTIFSNALPKYKLGSKSVARFNIFQFSGLFRGSLMYWISTIPLWVELVWLYLLKNNPNVRNDEVRVSNERGRNYTISTKTYKNIFEVSLTWRFMISFFFLEP